MQSSTPRSAPSSRIRPLALAVVLWAFGLATTTLLVGVWGRSVTGNEATLTASARAALDESIVTDRVYRWVISEVDRIEGLDPRLLEPDISEVVASPEVLTAVDALIAELVQASLAPGGSEVEVDVAGALLPVKPVIADQFAKRGVPVTDADVQVILDRIGALVLSTEDELGVTDTISQSRSTLTVVLVVGSVALLVLGAIAVRMSDDRARMVRSLASRLIVSSFTFTLFLRISAWAVDPFGGRSPLARAGAVVLASNLMAPISVGIVAGAVSIGATLAIRTRRRVRTQGGSLPAPEPVPLDV